MALPTSALGSMNPLLLAALMQQQQQPQTPNTSLAPQFGGAGGGASPQIPMPQQRMGSGMGMGGMMMPPPSGAGMGSQPPAQGGMNPAALTQLMQAFKGQQQTPPGGQAAPGALAGLFGSAGGNPMPSQMNPAIQNAGQPPSEYSAPIGPQPPSGLWGWLSGLYGGGGGSSS